MAALEYIQATGREAIRAHEAALGRYARTRIGGLPGVTVFGDPGEDGAIITFALDGAHANDVAAVVDGLGICIRAGAHCAQPLHALMGATSTCRASLAMYSTYDEVDALVDALHHARRLLC
jgi:cysteine desulfurase/selenocysteine lyase